LYQFRHRFLQILGTSCNVFARLQRKVAKLRLYTSLGLSLPTNLQTFKKFEWSLISGILLNFVDISNFTQNLTAMGTLHEDPKALFFHAAHE